MKKVWNNTTLFVIATGLASIAVGAIVYPVFPALVWVLLFLCWASYRLRRLAITRFGASAVARAATSASSSYWPDDEDENTEADKSEGS